LHEVVEHFLLEVYTIMFEVSNDHYGSLLHALQRDFENSHFDTPFGGSNSKIFLIFFVEKITKLWSFFSGSIYNHVWGVKWSLWVTTTFSPNRFWKLAFWPPLLGGQTLKYFWKFWNFSLSHRAFFSGSIYNHVWCVKRSLSVTSTCSPKGFWKFSFWPPFSLTYSYSYYIHTHILAKLPI